MFGTERRRTKRFGLKIPLRVRIPKSAAPERLAESLNVSAQGICFATDLPLREGMPVQLTFEMPQEVTRKPASEWRCVGHVVHVRRKTSSQVPVFVGVRFDCYEVIPPEQPSVSQASLKN
jgi:hypothetical protein